MHRKTYFKGSPNSCLYSNKVFHERFSLSLMLGETGLNIFRRHRDPINPAATSPSSGWTAASSSGRRTAKSVVIRQHQASAERNGFMFSASIAVTNACGIVPTKNKSIWGTMRRTSSVLNGATPKGKTERGDIWLMVIKATRGMWST